MAAFADSRAAGVRQPFTLTNVHGRNACSDRSIALVLTLGLALVLGSAGCQQTAPGSGDDDGSAGGGGSDFQTDTGDVETVTTTELSDLETIYFDYDKASDPRRPTPELAGPTATPSGRSRISASSRSRGTCDERGSEEYNLALGERRAYGREEVPGGSRGSGVPAADRQLRRVEAQRGRARRVGVQVEPPGRFRGESLKPGIRRRDLTTRRGR